MTYHIRPLNKETDFPRIAELLKTYDSIPMEAEALRSRYETLPEHTFFKHLMFVDDHDHIIGFANVSRNPWSATGLFQCWLIIDPLLRGRGLGSKLYQEMIAFVKEQGGTMISGYVRDDLPESLDFVAKRGLEKKAHHYESILDLSTFDRTSYETSIPHAESTGIRFATYADYQDTEENRRKMYDLVMPVEVDIPDSDSDLPTFEVWSKHVFEDPTLPHDGFLLALDGDEWVGVSVLRHTPGNDYMYHAITGVLRDYRGRQIAQALKVLAVDVARRVGVSKLMTNNHSANGPIIAINEKFGYKPQPGNFFFEGTL